MNSVIMDNVVIGAECIVGALSFVKADEKIPPRSLVAGNPARIIKTVSDEMISWKTEGTRLYQHLPAEIHAEWLPCEPLAAIEPGRPLQETLYHTWEQVKSKK
jgi:phenylacetic acid degradation protein/carnitine operon protein CaiE